MKFKSIAGAVLAAGSAAAAAQSSVTLYGIADAGLVREAGGSAGSVTRLGSGIASASRVGLRGSEHLGGGMAAIFTLESGLKIDTGELDNAATLFNRQAFVGIKSAAGSLTLGRQYTPYHSTLTGVGDPFGTGLAGTAKNLFPDSGSNVRTSNTLMYAMPATHGVTGELAYSAGEQVSASAGRQLGAAFGYAAGKLNVRLAFNHKNSDIAATAGVAAVSRSIGRNTLLAANYDVGVLKAYIAYGVDKGFNSAPLANANNPYGGVRPTASLDGAEVLLGFTAPLAGGSLVGSLMRKDDKTAFNQDARACGLAYLYPLSKRTTVYSAYARISNRQGAGYTVANNSDPGSGNSALNLGVRHAF
ncbi:porin [Massilia sp. DJPM01]|uniref:porin n=1 Tax=Massilia sp. DJPM01 TaxID=3024404 RepID=UPI00259F9DC7|nr:porin [Massilia sp. DJPM01]MDM5180058.1 porin [Massilia sp. DJPM01]